MKYCLWLSEKSKLADAPAEPDTQEPGTPTAEESNSMSDGQCTPESPDPPSEKSDGEQDLSAMEVEWSNGEVMSIKVKLVFQFFLRRNVIMLRNCRKLNSQGSWCAFQLTVHSVFIFDNCFYSCSIINEILNRIALGSKYRATHLSSNNYTRPAHFLIILSRAIGLMNSFVSDAV